MEMLRGRFYYTHLRMAKYDKFVVVLHSMFKVEEY